MLPDQSHVGVVILNWNGGQDTLRCIAQAEVLEYPSLTIVVVDNGSTDDSVELIRTHAPRVHIVRSDSNRGFGAGNNLGIAEALRQGAQFVWIINNDIDFEPGVVAALVRTARDARADIVGCWMFDATGSISLFCRNAAPMAYISSRSQQPNAGGDWWNTLEVSGAAVMLTRRMLEARYRDLGHYFDAGLFLYCEELELALWGRSNGYRAITSRDARIRHRVGTSASRLRTVTRQHYLVRNRIVVLRRYLGTFAAFIAVPAFACLTLVRALRNQAPLRDVVIAIRAGIRGETGKLEAARDH